MKKNILLTVSALLTSLLMGKAIAQTNNDPVLMNIAGEKVTKSEFLNVYKKNNVKNETIDKKSIDEYLELFINFKLKVKEAEELGLDTAASFKNELNGYRKQLAQPYMTDKEVTTRVLEEAYDRKKSDVKASHILINVNPDALPKDTLIAYNKIMSIRNRILKGEDFAKLASELSDDPSARDQAATKQRPANKGNGGDLGYFTVFQMVYPFETAAFNTKVGEISMPIRTRFGYHIIKVVDKRAAQGEIQTAHIMIRVNEDSNPQEIIKASEKIKEIYSQLKGGADFSELATKYSDDKSSAAKGGVLPWFGTGRMVPEFEKAAFSIEKNGDYTEPIKTMYGWHIIKRMDKRNIPTFEEAKNDIKMKVSRDSRSELSKEATIAKLKKEYSYSYKAKAVDVMVKAMDSTVFKGQWTADKAVKYTKPLFKFADKKYSQADFAKYIASHQTQRAVIPFESVVKQMYAKFVEEKIFEYEDSQLDKKYPEFRALMKEYRDGILLFELTEQKVWNKAVKDTLGLQQFYDANKTKYMWGDRVNATIYTCANEKIAAQTRALLEKQQKDQSKSSNILDEINKDSQLNLKVESTVYAKGDNKVIDAIEWKTGMTKNINSDNSVVFVIINEVLPSQAKTITEARGLITADYQNFLEKQWIESLRAKYKWDLNKDVFSSLSK